MINNIISNYSNTFDIFSKIVILKLFYTTFTIYLLYNLPLIFAYKLLNKAPPSFFKKTLYNLFNLFYKSPISLLMYSYGNISIANTLQHYITNAPTGLYQTTIINMAYVILYLFWYLSIGVNSIIPLTLIYSLYISEISYKFIDNEKFKFTNQITFYNSNKCFFWILGLIYSIMEFFYLSHFNFEIVGLFFYIYVCFPLLNNYTYANNRTSLNLFYIPENILGFILNPRCSPN